MSSERRSIFLSHGYASNKNFKLFRTIVKGVNDAFPDEEIDIHAWNYDVVVPRRDDPDIKDFIVLPVELQAAVMAEQLKNARKGPKTVIAHSSGNRPLLHIAQHQPALLDEVENVVALAPPEISGERGRQVLDNQIESRQMEEWPLAWALQRRDGGMFITTKAHAESVGRNNPLDAFPILVSLSNVAIVRALNDRIFNPQYATTIQGATYFEIDTGHTFHDEDARDEVTSIVVDQMDK